MKITFFRFYAKKRGKPVDKQHGQCYTDTRKEEGMLYKYIRILVNDDLSKKNAVIIEQVRGSDEPVMLYTAEIGKEGVVATLYDKYSSVENTEDDIEVIADKNGDCFSYPFRSEHLDNYRLFLESREKIAKSEGFKTIAVYNW